MKAIALLSGGLDSTVSLAYALSQGYEVVPLTMHYGQRHSRELQSAKAVAKHYGLAHHVFIDLDLSSFRTSALISKDVDVPMKRDAAEIGNDIPVTYVPARNIIFLSIAAGLCESEGADAMFIGANAIDYSGYPDCRPDFFRAFERTLQVGTKAGVEGHAPTIEHPLLYLTKADIVRLGKKLNAPLELTWSCYSGGAKACGKCDSCLLRLKGFEEAGYKDPIDYEG
ncbi:MAG: queuosine biosynthesis protein QueC [Methanomassiliicoccales archaeon PtaU1.Bin124]|nr:MAG: queuosine biosynthesis protein QueC [Methanomassiliicoccales archaeon PtaU1.Bin124]